MKILIGTFDICGWVNLYQKEFIKLGHKCDTIVKESNPLFPTNRFTHNLSRYQVKFNSGNKLVKRIENRINSKIATWFLRFFLYRKKASYDLVIYIWNSLLNDRRDIELFRKNGAKIIFLFAGSEVRSLRKFSSDFDVSEWQFPDYWLNENIDLKATYIRSAEQYGDQIYSVPDQAGLQQRAYYHHTIPIDLEMFKFVNNSRKVPKVLHMPSDPWKKGTDIIEAAIKDLVDEGIEIEFHSLRNIKHEKIPALLADMDVLIDEIVFHGPGVLAFEAMASGCAVATRYLASSPASFRPPVWSIDAKNIKPKLRALFQDFELRQQLTIDGRRYVERHNDSSEVARNLVSNLSHPRVPDYKGLQ